MEYKQILSCRDLKQNARLKSYQTKYKHIFIDLDDTLWDFKSNAKEALLDVFNDKLSGIIQVAYWEFYPIYIEHNSDLWSQYGQGKIDKDTLVVERFYRPLMEFGIDDRGLALEMNDAFLANLPLKKALVNYAIEFLDFCVERKLTLTLITNGFTDVQYKKLKSAEIEHYFDHIILSEKVGYLKPNPEIFEYAMDVNEISNKKDVLMIGDSFEADIQGAINFGIDSVLLNAKGIDIDKNIKNVYVVEELREAIEIIKLI